MEYYTEDHMKYGVQYKKYLSSDRSAFASPDIRRYMIPKWAIHRPSP